MENDRKMTEINEEKPVLTDEELGLEGTEPAKDDIKKILKR